ncbi:hypothetical protein [Patulibacter americanus]|uniref:hypothetical protein n=1 Tax=Patulibacter americanus TaxID=588672 RepID=UPI0003B7356A|nr:hypothetical protein [Patulibacter americanus]
MFRRADGSSPRAPEAPGDPLGAAVRRAEDAVAVARLRVAEHGRRTTQEARAAAGRLEAAARVRALDQAATLARDLRSVVQAAMGIRGGGVVVPVGTVCVRRHAEPTAAVFVPLLVSTGCGGGARIVAGEDAMPTVVTLAAAIAAPASADPLVVVNPRRRVLPAALRALPGLCEVRDGRGLLGAAGRLPAGRGRLVVLDHPHDLGLAGRRLVQGAGVDSRFRALLVHHAADAPDVDLEHRRLRVTRDAVPQPTAGCELWPARGGWRWSAHPRLRVVLPDGPAERGSGPQPEPPGASWERAPATGRASAEEPDLAEYERLLECLAEVAVELDATFATARRNERDALDRAAAMRRRMLDAIDVEARAIDLLLRRVGGARSPPAGGFGDPGMPCTAAPRRNPTAATDLTPLRAARAALARAIDTAMHTRGD